MNLYTIHAGLFGKGEVEVTLPAFSPETAAKKLQYMLDNHKLKIHTTTERTNQHTGAVEEIRTCALITGYIATTEIHETHRPAFHRRKWDEKNNRFHYPPPSFRGRSLQDTIDYDHLKNFSAGCLAARENFNRRYKPDTKLKATGNDNQRFAEGFRWQWARLLAKPAKKPARRRKTAVA